MANILADLNDINTNLPEDKLHADDTDVDLLQVEVARYIRSLLSGTFTKTTISSWDTPAHTPEIIRSVAGRLIAAKFYSIRYAEDNDESKYATDLYGAAIADLMCIRSGDISVLDSNGDPIDPTGTAFSSDDFWPNATAPAPKFSMDMNFGVIGGN